MPKRKRDKPDKGKKSMGKMLGVRVPKSFLDAINKSKWMLEKPSSEIVREAVQEYWQRHLSKEDLKTIQETLDKDSEADNPKRK